MGSVGKLLGMLPGMSEHKDAIANLDDKEFDRIRAVIQSMTPGERADVKVLNASRRQRIALGSGTQVSDVNQLVNRFIEARKMMGQMARGGGIPGMPNLGGGLAGGLGGFAGGGGSRGKKAKKGKKAKGRVSGNPAKRAEQLARQGAPADAEDADATEAAETGLGELGELPPEFTDLLGR
jgi:signal recognition particle subunit SRP54